MTESNSSISSTSPELGRRRVVAGAIAIVLFVAIGIPSCMNVETATRLHKFVLSTDPPLDLRGAPVKVNLQVRDEYTKQPLKEFVAVGAAKGVLRFPFVGHHWRTGIYFESGDRSLYAITGPRVATKAMLTENEAKSEYLVESPSGFQVSRGFMLLTNSHAWGGTVLSKGYCTSPSSLQQPPSAKPVITSIAKVNAGETPKATNEILWLRPLGNETLLQMRYEILKPRWISSGGLISGTPRAELYDELLGWAAPTSESPFAHLAYVSYLIRTKSEAENKIYAPQNATEIAILEARIAKHLPLAQRVYQEFDDWQLVPETARVEWGDPTARSGAAECLRPDVSARVGPSRWWNTATPLQDEARLREGLKPYPFCVANVAKELTTSLRRECEQNSTAWRAWDPEAYKWHPADGFMRPPNASPPEKAVPPVGYSTSGERTTTVRQAGTGANVNGGTSLAQRAPTCESQASSRISAMQARPRFKVQCRYGDAKKCNLNALNPFGDTALMSLARVDRHGVNAYPFSRVPDRPRSGWQPSNVFHSRRYTRYEAMRMMEALLRSGADPTSVHPVLGVNALETAIDPFIGGSLRSDTGGAWEAQAEMVGFLVSAFENNPRATIRADYLKAIERLAVVNEVRPLSYGEKPWRNLDATLIARMQKLPSRPEPRLCGESVGYPGPGWVQSPPVLLGHQTASPVDLR